MNSHFPVARQLDGVELDLGGDDAVLLGVVFLGVEPEQLGEAVVVDVLEPLAKLPPRLLGALRLEVGLLERAHFQVREALSELGVDVVVARTQPRDLLRVHGTQDLIGGRKEAW